MTFIDDFLKIFEEASLAQTSIGVGIMLVVAVGGLLLVRWLGRRLAKFGLRTNMAFDDQVAGILRRTQWYFTLALGLWISDLLVYYPDLIEDYSDKVLMTAALFQLMQWSSFLIDSGVSRIRDSRIKAGESARATSLGAVSLIAKFLVIAVLLLLALDNLGVDVTTLVAGLGIGGIAVALALQNILKDLFGSLSIILDKPFVVGDSIHVDDLLGTVERIGLKTTRVRSLSGEQLVFSNDDLLQSRIRNYQRMQERRISFELKLAPGVAVDHLKQVPAILKQVIEAQPKTRFERAHFVSQGDYAFVFEIVYYVLSADYATYMDVQHAVNLGILESFDALGVELATSVWHMRRTAKSDYDPGDGPEDRNAVAEGRKREDSNPRVAVRQN